VKIIPAYHYIEMYCLIRNACPSAEHEMSVGFIGVSDAQSLFVYVVITALPFP
jgi:hypothetical protein